MKTFIAIESAKQKRGRYTFNVYRSSSTGLSYLGEGSICYASTRGEDSEVWNTLIDLGIIPKSANKNSKYFSDRPERYKNIRIQYIVPKNQ